MCIRDRSTWAQSQPVQKRASTAATDNQAASPITELRRPSAATQATRESLVAQRGSNANAAFFDDDEIHRPLVRRSEADGFIENRKLSNAIIDVAILHGKRVSMTEHVEPDRRESVKRAETTRTEVWQNDLPPSDDEEDVNEQNCRGQVHEYVEEPQLELHQNTQTHLLHNHPHDPETHAHFNKPESLPIEEQGGYAGGPPAPVYRRESASLAGPPPPVYANEDDALEFDENPNDEGDPTDEVDPNAVETVDPNADETNNDGYIERYPEEEYVTNGEPIVGGKEEQIYREELMVEEGFDNQPPIDMGEPLEIREERAAMRIQAFWRYKRWSSMRKKCLENATPEEHEVAMSRVLEVFHEYLKDMEEDEEFQKGMFAVTLFEFFERVYLEQRGGVNTQ
eukprot:TRINITY_DN5474_c0_g1_i4.p1 TRINITY_DN5474_c0_g1~~TRINITY_DN5474_c0_g1_i4.p1  ORF type:complete len:397 (-),score=89.88 TRINITY_DN5474_c0_g1_i4:889-2079(-)